MAHRSPMLHSIYDLTTYCRATTGDVPPKLVGASTTVVGSKMYIFGGRLVTERRMLSDLYVFDMESFVWERIPVQHQDNVPRPRYFHSADTWNNHLIIFGGMSNQPDSINPDELCVLNDVHFFNLATRQWLTTPLSPSEDDPLVPRARYAHLSSVTGDELFIIGGQDFYNTWLDDICIFNLVTQTWIQRRDYPRHCGTYRSVAVSSPIVIRSPQDEAQTLRSSLTLGPVGNRFAPTQSPIGPPPEATPSENLIHLPYSAAPTPEHPSDIFLYSNYNFTDVKRELEIFSPLPDTDFTIQDRSPAMTGSTFPPGLRFPTGALLGAHLIIAGTYLAHSYQSFSIWVLDLASMTWSRIDPGKAIETGSWFRGCLWAEANKFMIFGNRYGNLVDDYNRRLLSWDHVAVVDLEAFGIYQPPPLKLDVRMQELGLAALEERVLTDFDVICEDGQRIPCSRRILEERWEWFKQQRGLFLVKAAQTSEKLPNSPMHIPLPDLQGTVAINQPLLDPRLSPRAFHLSEPYPIALAFLQYLYSMSLITPLQHMPGVLGQLLILATNYRLPHLESLVKHAMHRSLTNPNSVGVYEVTTLCSCRSLQIRALKTVMSYTQKRPSRKTEKENGSTSKALDNAGEGGHNGGGNGASSKYVTRPRGTSDAFWRTGNDSNGVSSSGYNITRNNEIKSTISEDNHPNPKSDIDPFLVAAHVPSSSLPSASPAAVPVSAGDTKPSLSLTLSQEGSRSPPFTASSPGSASPPSQALPHPSAGYPRSAMHALPALSAPARPSEVIPSQAAIIVSSNPPASLPSPPFLAQSPSRSPPDPTTRMMNFHRPRRPTTADNTFKGSPPVISLSSSSEDLRGSSKRRPSTSNGVNHSETNPASRAKPTQYNPGLESPTMVLPVSSGSSTSGATISSETLLTPPVEEFPPFPLRHAESKAHVAEHGYYKNATPISNEKLAGWPKQASNIRWVAPDTSHNLTVVTSNNPALSSPPPPLSLPPVSPPDILPAPSSGNAFKRFLSRGKNKDSDKERRPSTSHAESPMTPHSYKSDTTSSGVASPTKEVSLPEIERQIAELEEEKKKLKKEAKIKALLAQSTTGVAVIGGMAV